MKIDEDFFSKKFKSRSNKWARINLCQVIPRFDKKSFISHVRRIIVPERAYEDVSMLMEEYGITNELVSSETLVIADGPSQEGKQVGKAEKEMAERYIIREKFWTQLLDLIKQKTKLHANISPTQHNWLGTSAGKSSIGYNYSIRKNEAQVEVYIDRGKEKGEENKDIFDKLFKHKEVIEKTFGASLNWERLEGKRACRINKNIDIGGYWDSEEKWPSVHEAMVDAMIRLEKAVKPLITKLNI